MVINTPSPRGNLEALRRLTTSYPTRKLPRQHVPSTKVRDQGITQDPDPTAADEEYSQCVERVLEKVGILHPYPITCLAAWADDGVFLSGSQSVDIFFPGHGSTDVSDFDVYTLAEIKNVFSIMRIFRMIPVRWNNFLSTYLKQVEIHGTAIVPFRTIYDIVDKLRIPPETLREYLRARYDPLHHDFLESFARAYKNCCSWLAPETASAVEEEGENETEEEGNEIFVRESVWVFTAEQASIERVPADIRTLLRPHVSHSEENVRTLISAAKDGWKEKGWPADLLHSYIKCGSSSVALSEETRKTIEEVLKDPEPDSGEDPIYFGEAKGSPRGPSNRAFDILRGTLPNGTKLQLMLIPVKERAVWKSILSFYATHLITGVSGSHATHMYYSEANSDPDSKKLTSFKLDVSNVAERHRRAEFGMTKYELRGWTFKPLEKGLRLKSGSDEGVKVISLEQFYRKAALKAGKRLPQWWHDYFKQRKYALELSTWREDEGRVTNVTYAGDVIKSDGLLAWVQENLEGDPRVAPKHVWDEQEHKSWMVLDLWFGGAGGVAQTMLYV